ncbi:hypothetical protein HOY82DRAFT_17531 [Tuber indicum]|nr:hypothetical protein HOY82DRAFT_17531 [Tuber indicum]
MHTERPTITTPAACYPQDQRLLLPTIERGCLQFASTRRHHVSKEKRKSRAAQRPRNPIVTSQPPPNNNKPPLPQPHLDRVPHIGSNQAPPALRPLASRTILSFPLGLVPASAVAISPSTLLPTPTSQSVRLSQSEAFRQLSSCLVPFPSLVASYKPSFKSTSSFVPVFFHFYSTIPLVVFFPSSSFALLFSGFFLR